MIFRMLPRVLLLLALLLGMPAFAEASDPPANPAVSKKPDAAASQTYIVLLRLRYDLYGRWKDTGKWPDDPAADAALTAHGAYWKKQLQDGHALLAGGMKGDYWDNVALIVFTAGSEQEANAIVADDPAVKAYVFQAQVRPFDVSFLNSQYTAGKH